MIIFNTNHGPISIELNSEKAPKSAENFLQYAEEGFYNGTIFHRVIDGFMIQGGGFEPGMSQKANHDPIDNEADNGLSNLTGTLAMARTADPIQQHRSFLSMSVTTFSSTIVARPLRAGAMQSLVKW